MKKLKYITESGLQSVRAATERAYTRPSVSVNLPVATMLALLWEIDRLIGEDAESALTSHRNTERGNAAHIYTK